MKPKAVPVKLRTIYHEGLRNKSKVSIEARGPDWISVLITNPEWPDWEYVIVLTQPMEKE